VEVWKMESRREQKGGINGKDTEKAHSRGNKCSKEQNRASS